MIALRRYDARALIAAMLVALLALTGHGSTSASSATQAAPQVVSTANGVDVNGIANVPANATNGITVGSGQDAITAMLPTGSQASAGTVQGNSVVYDANDQTADKVVASTQGVQFLKTLNNAAAPMEFTYPVTVPDGGKLVLTNPNPGEKAPKFAALVLNRTGQVVATVDTPWAKDANGTPVETYFTSDGKSLTQHVMHTQRGVAYPVTADPYFHWYTSGVVVTLTYDDEAMIAGGGIITATALVGSSVETLIGPVVLASLLYPEVFRASWAVATHECAWFWIPNPLSYSDGPSKGTYKC